VQEEEEEDLVLCKMKAEKIKLQPHRQREGKKKQHLIAMYLFIQDIPNLYV
jgi:hypothetical protein